MTRIGSGLAPDLMKCYRVGTSFVLGIPADVRRQLNIRPGDRFAVRLTAEGALVYERVEVVLDGPRAEPARRA